MIIGIVVMTTFIILVMIIIIGIRCIQRYKYQSKSKINKCKNVKKNKDT